MKNDHSTSPLFEIPYYNDYISPALFHHIKKYATPVDELPDLIQVGDGGGLETKESLKFLCDLYDLVKEELNTVLNRRKADRLFIDQQTSSFLEFNNLLREYRSHDYITILGREDSNGRVVAGPTNANFYKESSFSQPLRDKVQVPEFLRGHHLTLFGPAINAKDSVAAMNCYENRLREEPPFVEELLIRAKSISPPKWGADNEDSSTPCRQALIDAGSNLATCFEADFREYSKQVCAIILIFTFKMLFMT